MDKARHPDVLMRKGFTLIELLIAISLLALMVSIVLPTIKVSIKAWEKGTAVEEIHQRPHTALSLLMEQIRSAYPLRIRDKPGGRYYIAFEGKEDSLDFVSSLPLSPVHRKGLCLVSYYLKEDPTSGTKTLMMVEHGVMEEGFFTPTKRLRYREEALELLKGVRELSFEYYGGQDPLTDWRREWDGGKEQRLPEAIRISIRFAADLSLPQSFVIPIYSQESLMTEYQRLREGPLRVRRRQPHAPIKR